MKVATDKLYSTAEAAELLGITESLVRRYCREGRIGARVGERWVISADEVRLFRQIGRHPGRPRPDEPGTSVKPKKSA